MTVAIGEGRGVDPPHEAYPPTFPIVGDDELARRTLLFEEETPAWTILLDAYGMLSSATCRGCEKRADLSDMRLTSRDREAITSFLAAHGELLQLDAPGVVKRHDVETGVFFQQETAVGSAGTVSMDRFSGTLKIAGHMWPGLPKPGRLIPEEALEAKLRARDDTKGRSVRHQYVRTLRSERVVEVHEAACLITWADSDSPHPTSAQRRRLTNRCVDARTGERLAPVCESIGAASRTMRLCDPDG